MAMFGLRVNQGPTLNLSGIFKSAMTDPDQVIKAELAKSKIWNDYYQNQVYQQQAEEQRQLGIKTGQEATDLRTLAEKKAAAVAGTEQGLVGAIPLPPNQPAPVEISRIAGPVNGVPVSAPPAIVDQNYYDSQVAGAKAQAGLMPYIAKDATDFATAYNKDRGGNVIAAGLTPGGPVAVTPDQYRLASELYTGSAPTTTTMVTSEDTAPAVNAVRETAGKLPYNIAQDRAKAQAEADAKVAARPLGDDKDAIYRAKLAELEAKRLRSPTGVLPQEEEQLYQLLDRTVSKTDQTTLGKDQRIVAPGPEGTGSVVTVLGSAPAAAGASGMYADPSATDARQYGGMTTTAVKMRDPGYKPPPQDAYDYETAYTERYRTGKTVMEPAKVAIPELGIAVGDTIQMEIKPTPPKGLPTPEEVYARAGIAPAGSAAPASPAVAAPAPATPVPAPVVAPTPAPVPAAAAGQGKTANGVPVDVGPVAILAGGTNGGVSVQKIANGTGAPATEAEGKLRGYAGRAIFGSAYLDKLTGADVPDFLTQYFNNPSNGDLTSQYIQSISDPATKQYVLFATAYLTAMLRKDSGAAITPAEFTLYGKFVPQPGDDATALASRREARHQFIRSSLRDGYTTDTRGRQIAEDEARAYNVHLEADPTAIPLTPTEQRNAPTTFSDGRPLTPMPQGIGISPEAWHNFSPEGEADAIKLYNMMKAKGLVK